MKGNRPGGGRGHGEAWEALDEGKKQRLREALREVWTDPSVISAREEVKVASDAYQRAIRSAIGKADPEVAEVLKKLQSMNEGRSQERLGGGPPVRMLPRRSGDYPIGPPSLIEDLSEEEKSRFREAERKAKESASVMAARAEMEEVRREDEKLRRKRMETLRRIRAATLEEMVRIDPSLGELRDELTRSWRMETSSSHQSGMKPKPEE